MLIPDQKDVERNSKKFNATSLRNSYPEFYEYLNKTYPNLSTPEQLYLYYGNQPRYCPCGKKAVFISFNKGYRSYCSSKCSGYYTKEAVAKTKVKKYGTPNFVNPEKAKKTILKKYGADNVMKLDEFKQKQIQTCIERYGVANPGWTTESQEKIKRTNLERYGVEYASQSPIVKKKSQQTKLERYGDEFYTNREQAKQTCLERFGSESPLNNPEIRKKIITTYKLNQIKSREQLLKYINETIWVCKCPHPECNKCQEKEYQTTSSIYYDRTRYQCEQCTKLNPINSGSGFELMINNILTQNNIYFQKHNRVLIPPFELDIYIPEKNIAIECNGIYWHSTEYKDKFYHSNKLKMCYDKHIRLISLWSHWPLEIIYALLLDRLGIQTYDIDFSKIIYGDDLLHFDIDEYNNQNITVSPRMYNDLIYYDSGQSNK